MSIKHGLRKRILLGASCHIQSLAHEVRYEVRVSLHHRGSPRHAVLLVAASGAVELEGVQYLLWKPKNVSSLAMRTP